MADVSAPEIAEAFGFVEPIGTLEALPQRSFVRTWRLATGAGPRLVKCFWPYDELPWRDSLERAMRHERRAIAAGVATPEPIPPVRPAFGVVARIEGHGLFRAYAFLTHRALFDGDDIAEWLGTTLARIHRLEPMSSSSSPEPTETSSPEPTETSSPEPTETSSPESTETSTPEPNWWYAQAPPAPPDQWLRWLEDGEGAGRSWAPALRANVALALEQSARVLRTFRTSPPYVMSHLDIEPWNVLVTDHGPVLIDWDSAGPESALLESAYVFVEFARRGRDNPDPDTIRRTHAACVAAGGQVLRPFPGILDRIIGRHLATITTALRGYFAGGHSEDQIRERIEDLPAGVARTRSWEGILATALADRP